MMKKVLIIANNDVGLYKFRKELVEELLKKYTVYISLPYGSFVDNLCDMGCKFIDTDIDRRGKNPFSDIKLYKKYRKIIKEVKPDVILTYTIKPNIYGALASKGKIKVLSNITGLGSAVENPGIIQKITLTLYKLASKNMTTVFFQNEENKQFFINNNINVKNSVLIPGSGVNLNYYAPLEYPNEGTIEFVFISRVMREKGIDQYLDAAKYITSKYPNTRFHICGFCEEEYESILSDLQEKNIIKYHGLVEDVREVLKNVHCTVHPTYYPEGMSNVLLESCASARPIITTNRSGCREIVDDGVNGFIVNQKDSKDLIEKIEEFINLGYLDKKQLGLNARKKVEKEFDRKIVINEYLKEINATFIEKN